MSYWKGKVLPRIKKYFGKGLKKRTVEDAKSFNKSKESIENEIQEKKGELQPQVVKIYNDSKPERKVIKAIHTNFFEGHEADKFSLLILILVALRYLHNQLWISVSRFQNARSKHQIQSKSIQFEQVDREGTWADYILLYALLFISLHAFMLGNSNLLLWNTKGIIVMILAHAGLGEFMYYWAHRALHHHFLYSLYHSHHHSSFVTESITSVVHPFAEHLMYAKMFSLALLETIVTNTASVGMFFGYLIWFDFMNNMSHCNFEFVPKWAFQIFPPLEIPHVHSLWTSLWRACMKLLGKVCTFNSGYNQRDHAIGAGCMFSLPHDYHLMSPNHGFIFINEVPPVLTTPLIFSTVVMSCITGIPATVKDLPDVEGDKLYGIKSFKY
eukprot:Gb_20167 [translate_table: standard]